MENKKTYNALLYKVSEKISLKKKKESDLSYNDPMAIHNTLHPFYQQLIGQYHSNKHTNGYAMPIIDVESISFDSLEKLCEFYLDYIRDENADPSVRKEKSNQTKIDLTTDTKLTDISMQYAEKELGKDIIHKNNNVEIYKQSYAFYQQTVRKHIYDWSDKYVTLCFLHERNYKLQHFPFELWYGIDFFSDDDFEDDEENSSGDDFEYGKEVFPNKNFEYGEENSFEDDEESSSDDDLWCIDKNEPWDIQRYRKKMTFISQSIMLTSIFTLDNFKESLESLEHDFNIWNFHYRTLLFIDIFCWIILQAVTGLITDPNCDHKIEFIQRICQKLDSVTRDVTPVRCSENIFMTYSEFRLFTIFRSHFLEDIEVLKQLEKTCTDFQSPQKQYSLINDDGSPKVISPTDRASIYLEGDNSDMRTFNSNYKKCKEFLSLYNRVTNRSLQPDDITLKAIYRELIIEKSERNKRKSKTILNKFLENKGFNNLAEYYFINEKINWGMYRERGLLAEFREKNKLQERLYILVNSLLSRLNPDDIYHDAYLCFTDISVTISDILSEHPVNMKETVDNIEDFLSKQSLSPYAPNVIYLNIR